MSTGSEQIVGPPRPSVGTAPGGPGAGRQPVRAGRVLVTGSAGFLGTAVARRLGPRLVPCDLTLGRSIRSVIGSPELAGVEAVVHCAAVQLFTPGHDLYRYETFYRANVEPLRELLDACVRAGVRKFIHVSTDMVYGIPGPTELRESDPLRPVGHYGRSKCEAEDLVRQAAIPVITILRPRVIAGPGRAGLFARLAALAQCGLPIPLPGSGDNRCQLIHVEDLADLIVEALARDVPGTFNAGALRVTTLRQKIVLAAACLGVRPRLVPIPERAAMLACAALYRARLGPLHPEQYLTIARNFVLSLEHTLRHFAWRPRFGDDEIIVDTFRPLRGRRRPRSTPPAAAATGAGPGSVVR